MSKNIRDLARMANTSVATVSRALSGKNGVSDEKRQNIIKLADELGFRPNRFAQNLSFQKSHMIGFIASTLDNLTYLHYYRIIEDYFKPLGYQLLIADSKLDLEKEKENIRTMLEHRAEGLLIFPVSDWHHNNEIDHFLELKLNKIPFVLLGRVEGYNFDCVFAEELESAYQIGRHLIELGHRRIGVVGYESQNRPARERLKGLMRAFVEAGFGNDEEVLQKHLSILSPDLNMLDLRAEELIREEARRWFAGPGAPTALVPISDYVAIGLYRPFHQLGIRIPEDVSIATFGDSYFSRYLIPSLTLMTTDNNRVAHTAAMMLDQRIADPVRPPMAEGIVQKFILRETTAPPSESGVICRNG
jgi:DNA-binding LacI/PurR family transcriptional regulator